MFVSGRVILEEVHAFTILPHTATLSPFYRRNSGLSECLVKKSDMVSCCFGMHETMKLLQLLSPRRAMVLVVRPARPRSIEQPLISARSAIQDINSVQMAVATLSSVLRLVRVNLARPAVLKKIEGRIINVRSAIQDSD